MKFIFFFSLIVFWAEIGVGQLAVPSIIGDHMVVKQNSELRLWGWNKPGAVVMISATWSKDSLKTRTNGYGNWETVIKTPSAGGPYVIRICSGKEEIIVQDVLCGEVWLCSGQSNMEWNGERGNKQIKDELSHCINDSIRFFYVDKRVSAFPQDNLSGKWTVCDATTLNRFSAIGYFFGKSLLQDLHVPMGLINSNWGATPVEYWMPEEVWQDARMKKLSRKDKQWGKSFGYNAMIYPLRKYNISGVIWYQGESNTVNANGYSDLFSAMIQEWRQAFGFEFPFYYVQLAPYAGCRERWGTTLIREQQDKTLSVPKTGMVVITDLVDDVNNIHPQEKREVGRRLAGLAAKEVYSKEKEPYFPRYQAMNVKKNKIEISFTNVISSLIVKGKSCVGFEIAGQDRQFYPALAKVNGDKVIVSAKEVKSPVAVRFGFHNAAIGNLFGGNGLPVTPFRTDQWPLEAGD